METVAKQTTDAIKHTIAKILPNGEKLVIDIRLGDTSLNKANGHADFSVTGSMHEKRGKGWGREPYMCGCIHDEVIKHAPELAPFVALHLSDQHGAPMYATDNGYYFLTNDLSHNRENKTRREVCQSHLRATDAEMDILEKAADKAHFGLLIGELGIPKRWTKEAKAATEQLEKWTGLQFEFTPTRTNFKQLSKEEKAQVEALVNSGHYAPEKVEERKKQTEQEQSEKRIAKAKEEAANKIRKVEDELKVELFMEALGYGERFKHNWIYYTHTNSLTFNPWNHVQAAADEVIERTTKAAADSPEQLPKGIKVEAKDR